MSKIYIHCDGGFGNRFNVLAFGLYLAKKQSYDPTVIWPSNNWCGADFSDLFDMDIPVKQSREGINFDGTFNLVHENQFGLSHFTSIHSINDIEDIKNISKGMDILYFNNLIPWNLVQDAETFKSIIKSIKFKDHLINESNEIIKNNVEDDQFYGIHIRKTDFGKRSKFAETNLLNLVVQNKSKKFFICSDDEATENLFLQNENVFRNEKQSYVKKLVNGDWNNSIVDSNNNEFMFNVDRPKESVIQAVIDLIILSKSTIISPDVGSTFHHTAALISKCK